MRISVQDLLAELVSISERSATISRLCRSDGLFELLIQEKTSDKGKNPRFRHDFKTFADVLIQEVAKYYLERKFPALSSRVYGEENNAFENKLGESVTVQVVPEVESTRQMLLTILDGNVPTVEALVQVIYEQQQQQCNVGASVDGAHGGSALTVEQNDIAIWIDPIDSTSEYIHGRWQVESGETAERISPHGLHCVTCLFGVFDTKTGFPLIGVLNQPFFRRHLTGASNGSSSYSGRCLWGYNIDGVCQHNLDTIQVSGDTRAPAYSSRSSLILVGNKEPNEMEEKLKGISPTMYVAGAGYKILCVISGEADLLVTSSKTIFFWDSCAGHAILRSLGGGIIALEDILQVKQDSETIDLERLQLRYRPKVDDQTYSCASYNHSKGLVAYRSAEAITGAIKVLQS